VTADASDIRRDNVMLGEGAAGWSRALLVLGVIGLAASAVLAPLGAESFFRGYLVNLAFFSSLALGALFFVILQHLTRAGWSVVVRRMAENVTGAFGALGVLALPIVLAVLLGAPAALHHVYHWTDAEHVAHDAVLRGKSAYLNGPFFALRMLLYFGLWIALAGFYARLSREQDRTGDAELTTRMQARSAPSIILYALSLTFFSFDLLMSLEAHWYSTIFGVYYFSGSALGFFALLAGSMHLLQRAGYGRESFTQEHFHDVGKLVFAFVVFWAYIAFSQYMLMWYGNLPEETGWYLTRQRGPWLVVSFLLLFGHFVVPFLLLISRYPKRHPRALVWLCAWVLVAHWIDMFYLVMPHNLPAEAGTEAQAAPLLLTDVLQCLTALVGIGGVFGWAVLNRMRSAALVPLRDPRLPESLAFHNI
jgi:hypothetical protein